jgi:hypothetical protein
VTEILGHTGAARANDEANPFEGAAMRTHSRKLWPPFLAVALLALLGVFVLDGVAAGVVSFVALLGLLGAAIYALAGEDVRDGCGGIGGGMNY